MLAAGALPTRSSASQADPDGTDITVVDRLGTVRRNARDRSGNRERARGHDRRLQDRVPLEAVLEVDSGERLLVGSVGEDSSRFIPATCRRIGRDCKLQRLRLVDPTRTPSRGEVRMKLPRWRCAPGVPESDSDESSGHDRALRTGVARRMTRCASLKDEGRHPRVDLSPKQEWEMTVTARKYNPGFLSDEELMESFCVRTSELEAIVDRFRTHQEVPLRPPLVIGPRGSGKTYLLLRIAVALRLDSQLSSDFFPVVFAEESYEVSTAGEFWLECLSHLATQTQGREDEPDLGRTYEELRSTRDDDALTRRCLEALLEFAEREGKKLVLVVENLNTMLSEMADSEAGGQLREILESEPRIVLLASATSRFAELDNPGQPFHDFFRVLALRPLDTNECAVLWETIAGRRPRTETIRSLEILTGGSPRLLAIIASFGATLSLRELMDDLLALVDDNTEYFKSHIEALPPQERRVYLALADLWKRATTREIAERARLDTSKCSAQLTRLVERGVVAVTGGTSRRKEYYLTERLYNIYYLMRRSRRPHRLIEALIRFMASYYSFSELREFGTHLVHEIETQDAGRRSPNEIALTELMKVLTDSTHEQVPDMTSRHLGRDLDEHRALADGDSAASADTGRDALVEMPPAHMLNRAIVLELDGRTEEALGVLSEIISQHGTDHSPDLHETISRALVLKGQILSEQGRTDEAMAAWNQTIRLFAKRKEPAILEPVGRALLFKATKFATLNRADEAMTACDRAVLLLGESDEEGLVELTAVALELKVAVFLQLKDANAALCTCDKMLARIGESTIPSVRERLAIILVKKGAILTETGRKPESLEAYEEVDRRFREDGAPAILESTAIATLNKGKVLNDLERHEEALLAFDDLIERFSSRSAPDILAHVAAAYLERAAVLGGLGRLDEMLSSFDEVERRFGEHDAPGLLEQVATALQNKGKVLFNVSRWEEALAVFDDLFARFGESRGPGILDQVIESLLLKGSVLSNLNRPHDAISVYDYLIERFGTSEGTASLKHIAGDNVVATAICCKAEVFRRLDRTEDALSAYEEVIRRYGNEESRVLAILSEGARSGKAEFELELGRYDAAIAAATMVLEDGRFVPSENRCWLHGVRARAYLGTGNVSACELEIESVLGILPELDRLPREHLVSLMELSVELGPDRLLEAIRASPAAHCLLPLVTALERELGIDSRVAQEVEEVAQDIRRDMANLRKRRSGARQAPTEPASQRPPGP